MKCPICKKNLYAVCDTAELKSIHVYNLHDPKYESVSCDFIMRCSRCHNIIGITYQNSKYKERIGHALIYEKTNN